MEEAWNIPTVEAARDFGNGDVALAIAKALLVPDPVTVTRGDEGAVQAHAQLGQRGVNELQVEAGATLSGALMAAGLVDENLLFASLLFDAAQSGAAGAPSGSDRMPVYSPDGRWLAYIGANKAYGAAFVDLQAELYEPHPVLRFTLPAADALAAAWAAAGLSDGDDCVVYSSTSPMWAARVVRLGLTFTSRCSSPVCRRIPAGS